LIQLQDNPGTGGGKGNLAAHFFSHPLDIVLLSFIISRPA
jgi:hypothetical protein